MKQDWAWNEASRLLALGAKDGPDAVRKLAHALRKAKKDGMRDAAKMAREMAASVKFHTVIECADAIERAAA